MADAWIVTTTPLVGALVDLGRALGGAVVVVAVGDTVGTLAGVDAAVSVAVPDGVPVEAMAPAVAAAVGASEGDVVFVPNRPAERVLGAAVAARLAAPMVTGAVGVREGLVEVRRHGGITLESLRPTGALVAVGEGGADAGGPGPEPTPAAPAATHALTVVGVEQVGDRRDLATADRIVAAGRGLGAAGLPLAHALADALDAEVGCTRPVAEDDAAAHGYIGVSGAHVHPGLYVALGVSGQLQHLAGVDAATVVTVNTDAAAPIWAHTDYGIVGDVHAVVPAVVAALGAG